MPRYRYEAVDAAGETLRDELEAPTPDAAVEQLRDRGLLPLSVNEAKGGLLRGGLGQPLFSKRRALSRKAIGLFTQQLASLLGAGMPLDRALTILIGVAEDEQSKTLLERVQEKVRGGSALADALEAQGAFSRFYLNMIRAGEAGGALETVREGETGLFFDGQTPESLAAALTRFEESAAAFSPEACRQNARRFSAGRFREAMTAQLHAWGIES